MWFTTLCFLNVELGAIFIKMDDMSPLPSTVHPWKALVFVFFFHLYSQSVVALKAAHK